MIRRLWQRLTGTQPVEVWATSKLLRSLGMTPATFAALVKFNGVRARCPCGRTSGEWDSRYEDGAHG